MMDPLLPMLATSASPFDSCDYVFEVKWDGVRVLASVEKAAGVHEAGCGPVVPNDQLGVGVDGLAQEPPHRQAELSVMIFLPANPEHHPNHRQGQRHHASASAT